ncbi:MAG: hypothetical protein HN576_02885 [Bacteriovoracaceae bacterium]|jgi:hypothetical protein|nr:hypothetical protein [Bacteriovoracaceae bacterium]
MRIKNLDRYIVLFGVFLLLFGIFQLNNLKFENKVSEGTSPIALVLGSENTVKKKSSMDIGWIDAWNGDPLFNQDQIFTYEGSSTKINFTDGPKIHVTEKTLFKIQQEEGVLNLDLTSGAIVASLSKSTGPFLVSMKNTIYKFEGDNTKILLSNQKDRNSIRVIEGRAKVSSKNESIVIKQNQKLELTSNSNLKRVPVIKVAEIKLSPPSIIKMPKRYTYYDENLSPKISWKEVKGAVSYKVKITDKETGSITTKIIEDKHEYQFPLVSGEHVFRVAAIDENGDVHNYSEEQAIAISYGTWDKDNGSVKIVLNKPDQLVKFTWQDNQAEGDYIFELSTEADFKSIIVQKKLKVANTNISFPRQGVYFWRSRQFTNKGKSIFEKPIKVIITPSPPPLKPILKKELKLKIKKKRTSFFHKLLNYLISKAHAENAYVDIPLPKNDNAKSYVLKIYNDETEKNLVLKRKINTSIFRWNNVEAGEYYYKISIIDFWGRQGPFSELSKLIIEYEVTKNEVKENSIKLISPVHKHQLKKRYQIFSWRSKNNEEFTFQISEDLAFSKIIFEKKVKSSKIRVNRKKLSKKLSKKLYWRVLQGESKSRKRKIIVLGLKKLSKKKKKIVSKPSFRKRKSKGSWNNIWAAFKPSVTDYERKLSRRTVKFNGTVLNGLQVGWKKISTKAKMIKTQYEIQFNRASGKVFDNFKYYFQNIRFSLGNFNFGLPLLVKLNLSASDISSYNVNKTIMTQESEQFIHGGVGIHYSLLIFNEILDNYINYEVGSATFLNFGTTYNYQLPKYYGVFLGLEFENISFEKNDVNSQLQQISVKLGVVKSF